MWNAGIDGSQAEIKISGRNINNLRYADNFTLMAESKEELKNLLMNVKEENEKLEWNSTFKKMNIMASSPITSWQIHMGKVKTVTKTFIFLGSKITVDDDCSHKIKRRLFLEEKLWQT